MKKHKKHPKALVAQLQHSQTLEQTRIHSGFGTMIIAPMPE